MRLRKAMQRGLAIVEMAVVLPVILVLMVVALDFALALQAQNIIVNVSREGANIAARSTTYTPDQIMDALALTANPLQLQQRGMIYVTRVAGTANSGPVVLEQYRWTNGGLGAASQTWSGCGGWSSQGECLTTGSRPTVSGLPLALNDGEAAYAVEVFYEHETLTFVLDPTLNLYHRVFL